MQDRTDDLPPSERQELAEDIKTLHSMGYAQELLRRMSGFSNFAISFSIICILSGGINSVFQSTSGVGGAAIGIGWPIGCLISLVFALGMAQIASAYPTAGGLYHWGSILGGRFWGWLTAWLNLIGLITVLAAINVGTFSFFVGAFPSLGLEATYWHQFIFVALLTASQALFNHLGIKVTTLLTDFSGYLILLGTLLLAGALFYFAPSLDFGRLFEFKNYSGDAGGGVWPESSNIWFIFLLGLLHPIYTITGYDASAHTSEETKGAAKRVPSAMVRATLISSLFGWLFLIAFVLALPNMDEAAKQGTGVYFWALDQVLPAGLKEVLHIIVFAAQYLCGLATVTSMSRMIFAFSRDGGLPFSSGLRKVSPRHRVPVAAIWTGSVLSVLFTMYTDAYTTVVSVTVLFLFISYGMPIALGLFAYKRTWTKMGPWDLGALFPVVAILTIASMILIFYIGVQPPNDQALTVTIAFLVVTGLVWVLLERKRFQGPPIGDMIKARQAEILAAEAAVGEIEAGAKTTGLGAKV